MNGFGARGNAPLASAAMDIEKEKAKKGFKVSPWTRALADPHSLIRILFWLYLAIFLVHRLTDLMYLCTMEARFPEGMGQFYGSDFDRLQTVRYTQEMIFAAMSQDSVTLILVAALVFTNLVARLHYGVERTFEEIGSLLLLLCPSFAKVLGGCLFKCLVWLVGGCCSFLCCCCSCVQPSPLVLLREAVFLASLVALFHVVKVPFMLWMFNINVEFGFTNILTVSVWDFQRGLLQSCIAAPVRSIPVSMATLAIVRNKRGWIVMWLGLMALMVGVQIDVGILASTLGRVFPAGDFAVAHGFPLMPASPKRIHDLISLNRIYYGSNDTGVYRTDDKSRGDLELVERRRSKTWLLRDFDRSFGHLFGNHIYAEANPAEAGLEGLNNWPWNAVTVRHDKSERERPPWHEQESPAAVSVRHGKFLRRKLFTFANDHHIDVGEVYMVDGSYRDTRANAFVVGAGSNRVIGLYDTLFLGDNGTAEGRLDSPDSMLEGSLSTGVSVQTAKDLTASQGVAAADTLSRSLRHKRPIAAMTDMEILAILGHELGHSAMHHVERSMVVQAGMSFLNYALLGWMVHSASVAGVFIAGSVAPIVPVGLAAFYHLAAPAIGTIMKLVTDALTRSNEYAADAYSSRVSEVYADNLQAALIKLSLNSNMDPAPPWFFAWLHTDHPTLAQRWSAIETIKKDLYHSR